MTVVRDEEILFTRGYGYANVAEHRLVDPMRTLFRPGSVSKLFTWTALMQQVELGRVDLDADVNSYLDFKIPPFEGQPIRVRDLMQHTPGMSDVGGIITRDPKDLPDYREVDQEPYSGAPVGTRHRGLLFELRCRSRRLYRRAGLARAIQRLRREAHLPAARHELDDCSASRSRASSRQYGDGLPALVDGRLVAQPFEYVRAITPAGASRRPRPIWRDS